MMEREASASAVVATDPASVDADCDNGTELQFQACHGLSKPRQKVFPRTRVNMGQRETASLAIEALNELLVLCVLILEQLEGHVPIEDLVVGQKDISHASAA